MLGVAALVGLTGLVYYMGYNDVDKRHRQDGEARPAPNQTTTNGSQAGKKA